MWEAFFGREICFKENRYDSRNEDHFVQCLTSFPYAAVLQSKKGPLCLEDAGCVRNEQPLILFKLLGLEVVLKWSQVAK